MIPDPCPCCGGFTSISRKYNGPLRCDEDMGFAVVCINPDCSAFGQVRTQRYVTPELAVSAWNREVRGNG